MLVRFTSSNRNIACHYNDNYQSLQNYIEMLWQEMKRLLFEKKFDLSKYLFRFWLLELIWFKIVHCIACIQRAIISIIDFHEKQHFCEWTISTLRNIIILRVCVNHHHTSDKNKRIIQLSSVIYIKIFCFDSLISTSIYSHVTIFIKLCNRQRNELMMSS